MISNNFPYQSILVCSYSEKFYQLIIMEELQQLFLLSSIVQYFACVVRLELVWTYFEHFEQFAWLHITSRILLEPIIGNSRAMIGNFIF